MVRLTDRPDMTLDVYRGRKTTMQQQQQQQPISKKVNVLSRHPVHACGASSSVSMRNPGKRLPANLTVPVSSLD